MKIYAKQVEKKILIEKKIKKLNFVVCYCSWNISWILSRFGSVNSKLLLKKLLNNKKRFHVVVTMVNFILKVQTESLEEIKIRLYCRELK